VKVEKLLSNPKLASEYEPGDLIRYKQGSPNLDGIPHNSTATVLSVNPWTNSLTVQTAARDEATYSPHLLGTMTAESTVYRQEQREFASGDRVQFTRADDAQGIRKGELGTITAIPDGKSFEVKRDSGSIVQLNTDQARHLDYGYAVESIKAGAPERILFTQETAANSREIESLLRNGREVGIYTSDGTPSQKQEVQSQAAPTQAIQNPVTLPLQPQSEAPALAQTQAQEQPAVRIRMGR